MSRTGACPGATLGVVTAGGERAVRVAGHAALVPEREALTERALVRPRLGVEGDRDDDDDPALADQGKLDLDAPLTTAIPDLRQYDVANAPERRLTFRDCLAHRTFLPAVEPIYTYGDDPERLRAFVLQREWRHGPPVYSDINFILLGIAIERITGQPLSAWPLGEGLSYGPPPGPAVATEFCHWRGRVLKGEVHDENCFALGGAGGHAGLFGTVAGVLDFAARTARRQRRVAGDARRDPHAAVRASHVRVGQPLPWLAGRRCLLGRDDRAYRIHRHRAVDRFRRGRRVDVAHQPRPSDPAQRGGGEHLRLRPATGDAVIAAVGG